MKAPRFTARRALATLGLVALCAVPVAFAAADTPTPETDAVAAPTPPPGPEPSEAATTTVGCASDRVVRAVAYEGVHTVTLDTGAVVMFTDFGTRVLAGELTPADRKVLRTCAK